MIEDGKGGLHGRRGRVADPDPGIRILLRLRRIFLILEMFFPLVKATFDEENNINVAYKEIGPNFGKRAREGHETGKGRQARE